MSFNLDRLKHSTLTCSVASGGTERKQGNNISNMKSEYFIASAPKANRMFKIFSALACIVFKIKEPIKSFSVTSLNPSKLFEQKTCCILQSRMNNCFFHSGLSSITRSLTNFRHLYLDTLKLAFLY